MKRVFDDSFKKMAVELSYSKGSVLEAAKELDMDASRLSKWRMDARYNGGTVLPKNDKLSPQEQEIRELKKRLRDAELENAILKKWVGDITYIKTASGWTYLTTVIDLADRKVVGWSFSNDMSAGNTTVKALARAIKNRRIKPGLIFHSDRGIQYACDEFKLMLNKSGIKQSMSRKGNCWDNAVAESFFKLYSMRVKHGAERRIKTLKTECIYHHKFVNREIAKLEVFRYIEGFYHAKRIHSAIGYRTPNEMEMFYLSKQKLAA